MAAKRLAVLPAAQGMATHQMTYGTVERVEGTTLEGWAVDLGRLGQPALLVLLIDGQPVGLFNCTVPRPDMNARGFPGLELGFSLALPDLALDGRTHTLAVRFRDGSPIQYVGANGLANDDMQFRYCPTVVDGHVDGLTGITARGWAYRIDTRTDERFGAVVLEVWSNGIRIDTFTASAIRADVSKAHRCPPQCGFFYILPSALRNNQPFSIEFRSALEGTTLPGSPLLGQAPDKTLDDQLHTMHAELEGMTSQIYALKDRLKQMLRRDGHTLERYHDWAVQYYAALPHRLAAARCQARAQALLADHPVVSVICPAYKPERRWFQAAIDSVRAQSWPHWELLIVDDGSRDPALTRLIAAATAADGRIRALPHAKNQGISAATNTAIDAATGAYVALFDHDDLLVPEALEIMLLAARDTGAAMVYSDEDKIDDDGLLTEPHFKTDWNPRLILSNNYVCHLLLIDTAVLQAAGPLLKQYDGAQDHELVLRLSRTIPPGGIHHVAELLYHWRKTANSTAAVQSSKSYAVEAGRQAVVSHLDALGLPATVAAPYEMTLYDVHWQFKAEPSVAILIPFKDEVATTRQCVDLLLQTTAYDNYQVVLIDNWSIRADTAAWVAQIRTHPRVQVLRVEEKFNFSALNNRAAQQVTADYLLFMNNDIFIQQADWLRVMMNEALADPRVGAVGIKLLYPNTSIQHAGVVLGVGGVADHMFRFLPATEAGYCARALCAQDLSAVTAACLLCRTDAFHAVGQFDADALAVAFNDVDLCLRLRAAGYRVLYTPSVVAEHRESLSRGSDLQPEYLARFQRENQTMLDRWRTVIARDPFYNPNFSRETGMFDTLSSASLDPLRAQPLVRNA